MPTPKAPRQSADALSQDGLIADSDLSSYKHRLVKKTSTGVALCGSGEIPYGVLNNAPASGAYASVLVGGTEVTGVAGGTIAVGDYLKPASNGKLVATSTSGDECCGQALSAASSDGLVVFTFNRFTVP